MSRSSTNVLPPKQAGIPAADGGAGIAEESRETVLDHGQRAEGKPVATLGARNTETAAFAGAAARWEMWPIVVSALAPCRWRLPAFTQAASPTMISIRAVVVSGSKRE